MLRVFCVAIGLMMATLSAQAGAVPALSGPSSKAAVIFVDSTDNNDVIIQSESKRPRQPYVRPQRYMCVVDQSGIGGTGQAQCPAKAGRVGGKCRCANVTGSGTLYTY